MKCEYCNTHITLKDYHYDFKPYSKDKIMCNFCGGILGFSEVALIKSKNVIIHSFKKDYFLSEPFKPFRYKRVQRILFNIIRVLLVVLLFISIFGIPLMIIYLYKLYNDSKKEITKSQQYIDLL